MGVGNSTQREYGVWEKRSKDKAPRTPPSERQVEMNSPPQEATTCRNEGEGKWEQERDSGREVPWEPREERALKRSHETGQSQEQSSTRTSKFTRSYGERD